jgi:hypothetical protein
LEQVLFALAALVLLLPKVHSGLPHYSLYSSTLAKAMDMLVVLVVLLSSINDTQQEQYVAVQLSS